MAKEVSLCLFFLSFLIISSSGALVGFSYHERGDTSTSSGTISFLQQSNVPSSQIQMFVTDHRILSTLTNSNVLVDVYLNKSQVENFIASKPQLLNFLSSSYHIKSIIISCGSEWLSKNEVPLLLNALKSIHSVLSKLHIDREVKLSVEFPLSFLEKLSTSHKNDIVRIFSFIKETKSFVTIEDSIDGEKDHFVQSIIKRASLAASILPCKDVTMVLKFKATIMPNSIQVAQFSKRVSKYLEARTHITKRIVALYVEVNTIEDFSRKELKRRRILDDATSPTNTVFPTNPASKTPIITPSDTPTIIQVPSTNPVTISPTNPAAIPVTVPPSTTTTTPVPLTPTNPANSPLTPTNPANPATTTPTPVPVTSNPPPSGTVPVTSNPPPSGTVPVINPQPPPSTSTNAPPSIQGQSWCVAKTGAPEASLQSALDYACGMGGADCSQIQQGGSCYSPITLQNHASYAFNSYYQKNPAPTSCDFGGAATLVNTNPSTGSCIFPSSSSSSSSSTPPMSSSPPTTPTPTQSNSTPPPSPVTPPFSNPTPPATSTPIAPPTPPSSSGTATSVYGTPPSVLNSSNPAASGIMPEFGSESPPIVNTTSASNSVPMTPFVSFIVLMISFVAETLSMRL